MMQWKAKALAFMQNLQQAYLVERDIDKVAPLLDEHLSWIGTGLGEQGHSRKETLAFLREEQMSVPDPLPLTSWEYQIRPLSDALFLAEGGFYLVYEPGSVVYIRVSAVLHLRDGEFYLSHLHLSAPSLEQGSGQYFPRSLTAEQAGPLQVLLGEQSRQIQEKNENLNALLTNLPGGVMSCDTSEQLNLLQYSSGFLDLFGYTADELEKLFHNQLRPLILPEDFALSWKNAWSKMTVGTTKETEYRCRRKDGSIIHILDRGQLVTKETGEQVFYCILMDVTETKRAREALRLSLERYQIIMDQSSDIIFEWDIQGDILHFAQSWKEKFGYDPILNNVTAEMPKSKHIHPDDLPLMQQLMERFRSGQVSYAEEEMRFLQEAERYIWCRLRVTLQLNADGTPARAVGILTDIDQSKQETQQLRRQAERDGLTGLYNKKTTEKLAAEQLAKMGKEQMCALFIIDVDNFKQVNDLYGHLSGDVLLSSVGTALTHIFREQDVIGRVGGDEFVVLMGNLRSEEVARVKAQAILQAFSRLTDSGEGYSFATASVGIALAPQHGRDYHTLYNRADAALYQAKASGKNTYVFYHSQLVFAGYEKGREADMGNAPIDSEHPGSGSFSNRLAEYVFNVLAQSADLEIAIPRVLEIVGRRMNVSRAYIFEENEKDHSWRNTYEWCDEGVEPQIDLLQAVPYAQWENYYDNLREGFFYCQDVAELPESQRLMLEAQGIRSMLQCAIRDNGRTCGFVGFDECRGSRFWNREQQDALSLIGQILSTFLMKERARTRTQETLEGLTTVLDHQESWIYVVRAEDLQVLYVNKAMRDLCPAVQYGRPCYQEFYGRPQRCAHCPIGRAGENGQVEEPLYSPVLKREVFARVAEILWAGGQRAYLFSCTELPTERL